MKYTMNFDGSVVFLYKNNPLDNCPAGFFYAILACIMQDGRWRGFPKNKRKYPRINARCGIVALCRGDSKDVQAVFRVS